MISHPSHILSFLLGTKKSPKRLTIPVGAVENSQRLICSIQTHSNMGKLFYLTIRYNFPVVNKSIKMILRKVDIDNNIGYACICVFRNLYIIHQEK
jgi:hypothetical protein